MPTSVTNDLHIELASGARYYPNTPHSWNIYDVAHSLSNQCRYTGHCRRFYSVAEHSVLCSLLSEDLGVGDPFECLMHDSHESVISDMAAPWKPHLKDFRAAEKAAEQDMRAYYSLPEAATAECKQIDWTALYVEAYFLMKSRGEGWADPMSLRVRALKLIKQDGWGVRCLTPDQARVAFLKRFKQLMVDRNKGEWWLSIDSSRIEDKR